MQGTGLQDRNASSSRLVERIGPASSVSGRLFFRTFVKSGLNTINIVHGLGHVSLAELRNRKYVPTLYKR